MNKINNIFDSVSYSNVISTIDFYTASLHIKGLYNKHHNKDIIQTDNLDYTSSHTKPNPLRNITLGSVSSAFTDAETNAKLAKINVSKNIDAQTVLNARAEVFGIGNDSWFATGDGDNNIIGLASIETFASLSVQSDTQDELAAIANSESNVVLDLVAIGLGNNGTILSGKGNDLIGGIADTTAKSTADAKSLAESFNLDLELESGTAEANAFAFANSKAITYGLANSGKISAGQGNDIIFGIANSDSTSEALANAIANSSSSDEAAATANARAVAITQAGTVGIINSGDLDTGVGHDSVIGIAFNSPAARAGANAVANGESNNTSANVDTSTFSDTSEVIAIGIDNSEGFINTSRGADQLFAYGNDIGILGGRFWTGKGNDKVFAYSETTGIKDADVGLGGGSDYFQAAIGELDPLTGEFQMAENQADSLVDSTISGHGGHDTFEVGDFGGNNIIDGGYNFDTLRLFGDVDSYQFTVGASDPNVLTIENSDSILTVKNVEAIYLGDSEQFVISDFA